MKKLLCSLLLLPALYLGLHNGSVALLQDSSREPVYVFPYSAELYTEADRILLKEGLPVESRKDLTKLLEDYFS